MKASIHNYPRTYNFMRARLDRMPLPEETKKVILEFDMFLSACQLSVSRRNKYLDVLPTVARELGVPLRQATKDSIMGFLTRLESRQLSVWTRHDYRIVIKRFWKWLKGNDEEYPPEVKWIKTGIPRSKRPTRHADEMLNEEDVRSMIAACTHPRDRAIIATLWDAGGRV